MLDEAVAVLKPVALSLDAFNTQYLQSHASGLAILACAKVLRMLDAPRDEVESLLFTALGEGTALRVEVRCCALGGRC